MLLLQLFLSNITVVLLDDTIRDDMIYHPKDAWRFKGICVYSTYGWRSWSASSFSFARRTQLPSLPCKSLDLHRNQWHSTTRPDGWLAQIIHEEVKYLNTQWLNSVMSMKSLGIGRLISVVRSDTLTKKDEEEDLINVRSPHINGPLAVWFRIPSYNDYCRQALYQADTWFQWMLMPSTLKEFVYFLRPLMTHVVDVVHNSKHFRKILRTVNCAPPFSWWVHAFRNIK